MRRLERELQETTRNVSYDIELFQDSLFQWDVAIHGPDNTPYFGGTFLIRLSFPPDYPLTSPSVKFSTKIYHPNVNHDGKVCLDLLGTGWKINTTPLMIIRSIVELLKHPDPSNSLYPEIASMMVNDRDKFIQTAIEWTTRYA
jgi:ubiquitin-conjugating enzyme E2 D/E